MKKTSYDAIDFNTLYKVQKQASTHKKKGVQMWDDKAEDMNVKIHRGTYNEFVQSKIDLNGVKSFLDVGCGPGTFALYYAPLVREVVAFDFSPKMLEKLEQNAREKNLANIKAIQANIEGDWKDIPVCDVVLASRCFEVDDPREALEKLNAHARVAVYMSFKVGKSFLSDKLLSIIGREVTPRPDYIYIINILYQMGIRAKLDFVPSDDSKCCKASNLVDEYVKSISWSLEGMSEDEERRVREHFALCEKKGITPEFRNNGWAIISWEK